MNVKILKKESGGYPAQLNNIPNPPTQLYVMGDISNFSASNMIAIVGSRRVTPYGRQVTQQLTSDLVKHNFVIVSGLALGVDSIAHRSCLDKGGKTIAVLPSGLDKIYPASHHNLAKEILANGGTLVSEYADGEPPLKNHFIARNRIVSGIGQGVLVTEAAAKSGTLHTANFALDQGKSVMAVPGNITSPLSQGTNNLIKTGATPVTSVDDVLFALGTEVNSTYQTEFFGNNSQESSVLQLLKAGHTDSAYLLTESAMEAQIFNQTMTMLELDGKIRSLGNGHWTLR
jgi:DNA processing protein